MLCQYCSVSRDAGKSVNAVPVLELPPNRCRSYIGCMVLRSNRGGPLNAPAAFIHPCQPIVAKQPPSRHSRRGTTMYSCV
jgi:hypothetical protein